MLILMLGNGSGTDFGASQCIPMGPCRLTHRLTHRLTLRLPLGVVIVLHVQILQDLVLFVHSQAAMLKEKSTTIEKQSETIDILSTRVQRLEDDNLVRFQLCLLLARLESAYLWIRGAHQI